MELFTKDTGRGRALLKSGQMGIWMAQIKKSSSFIAEIFKVEEWRDMMLFFQHRDVSGIKTLQLSIDEAFPELTEKDGLEESRGFGFVLGSGRFSALKTLDVYCGFALLRGRGSRRGLGLGLGDASLAGAFITGHFTNLHELFLTVRRTYDVFDLDNVFEALMEGRVSQLTSFYISLFDDCQSGDQTLDALMKSQCLRNLTSLGMLSRLSTSSMGNIFVTGIKSGLLPNVRSLLLERCPLRDSDLVDLVEAPGNWFSSLESLTLCNCIISAAQVLAMVKAITKPAESELALQTLDLHGTYLDDRSVLALINLVESDRLKHLQVLDLSKKSPKLSDDTLARLMGSIQAGHLPRLKKLAWEGKSLGDQGAQAVAQAYFENEALTADIVIDWHQVSDSSLKAKAEEFKERNARLVAVRNQLEGEFKDLVPLRSAKVFLCGFPEVGKTTLRKALRRHFGKRTKLKWERRPPFLKNEPRTKGIELRRIEDKTDTRLMLWDLAGQEEFHVLHGTFFADLGFAGGKATQFVIVFKVPFEDNVEAKLMYWLKFVAASSIKLVKRKVLIVLNCFDGKQCLQEDKRYWMGLVQKYAEKFIDTLQIHPDVMIIDARVAASVQPLKDQLFSQAHTLLQDVEVPKACFKLLEDLKQWSNDENKSSLPIFSWHAFEDWKFMRTVTVDASKNLRTCASYLHEIGEIIYFDEKESIQPRFGSKRIVVPDPEWFCKQVVGQLLLPKAMLEGDSPLQVKADGTISIIRFQAFYGHLLPDSTESDDVISMLQQVGLCYRKGLEEIVIPALISEDNYASVEWEGQGFHGVMGRCLATEDTDMYAIPGTLFRRLQVELAEDPDLGGCGDSEYRAGRSYSSFKHEDLLVLVEFDVDHSDPDDDRIDILVKSVCPVDSTIVRSAKIDCICKIMQKLERLCVTCCPGLSYEIKVIQPWNAKQKSATMIERRLMSLTEIKSLLVKGRKYLGWTLNGDPVEIESLFSKSELAGVRGRPELEHEDCEQEGVSLGLSPDNSEEENGTKAQGLGKEGATVFLSAAQFEKVTELISTNGQAILQRLDDVEKKLSLQIQAHYSFSIAEQEKSIPRFLLLKKKDSSGLWTSFKDGIKAPFREDYRVHFLCESQFETGNLHWVKDQEGLKLSKTKPLQEWLQDVEPWVRWSLYVATIATKLALTFLVPGTAGAIPTISTSEKKHDRPRDSAIGMMQDKDETIHYRNPAGVAGQFTSLKERLSANGCGNVDPSALFIDVNTKLVAQGVVNDLIKDLGMGKFLHGTRLRRVLLKATPQHDIGCSQNAESVVWICVDCLRKYGEERARDITPH